MPKLILAGQALASLGCLWNLTQFNRNAAQLPKAVFVCTGRTLKKHCSHFRRIGFGTILLIATACAETRDPSQEAPVDPAPGLYEVFVSSTIFSHPNERNGNEPLEVCLQGHESATFPYSLAEDYSTVQSSCYPDRHPREGNAIAGEITCAADPKLATGTSRFVYKGAIAKDIVTLEIRMKIDAAIKDDAGGEVSDAQLRMAIKSLERMTTNIVATRIGDCP